MKHVIALGAIAILLIAGASIASAKHGGLDDNPDPDRLLPICREDIKNRQEATEHAREHNCCFPELPPGYEKVDDGKGGLTKGEWQGGCGLVPFFKFLRNIIRFLTLRVMPILVAIFVVAGGFVIMTSTGKPEQYNKGKKMITIALVGALITLAAYLIVQAIFTALTGDIYTGNK